LVDVIHEPRTALPVREVEARSRALSARTDAAGVFWVSAGAHELVLRLFDATRGRLFERRVPSDERTSAAGIENVALIAASASVELLDGSVTTMTPLTEAATSAVEPNAPTSPSTLSRTEMTTAALESPGLQPARAAWEPEVSTLGLRPPASDEPTAGPNETSPDYLLSRAPKLALAPVVGTLASTRAPFALTAAAGFRLSRELEVGLGYEVVLSPSRVGLGGDEQEHPVVLSGGYSVLTSDRWDLAFGSRFVADLVTRSFVGMPHGFGPGRGASDTGVRCSLGPTAELGFRIVPSLRIGLLGGTDVVANPPSLAMADRVLLVTGIHAEIDLDVVAPRALRLASSDEASRKH
jgi:hypothetical protein